MKVDRRDPNAMGGVILQSLERLRSEGMKLVACEAADRMERLHCEGRVVMPDYASTSRPRGSGVVQEAI